VIGKIALHKSPTTIALKCDKTNPYPNTLGSILKPNLKREKNNFNLLIINNIPLFKRNTKPYTLQPDIA